MKKIRAKNDVMRVQRAGERPAGINQVYGDRAALRMY